MAKIFSNRRLWLERLPFTREGLFWLLIALALLVTGLLKGINLVNLLASWVIMLIAWNFWLARRQVRDIQVSRLLPEWVFAKTPFHWTVILQNAGARPARGLTVTEAAAARGWFVESVPSAQATRLDGETTLPCRGAYRWERVRLACGYPVGLANVVRDIEVPEEILVLPRLGFLQRSVLRHWLNQHCLTQGVIRASGRRQPNAQLEFHGLRPFRPGDSPRHIHWRTTARRGQVMVREFEDLPNDNLILIIDPWTPAPALPGTDADLEKMLSLAATIVWEWCRQKGDDFALAIAGPVPVWLRGVTGERFALEALQSLARVQGSSADFWPALLGRVAEAELPAAAPLVLSQRPNPPVGELAHLLRRPVACIHVAHDEAHAFFEENAWLDGARQADVP